MMKLSLLLPAALLFVNVAEAQIHFDDVSAGSGIDYRGKSYGSSWGDINGDGLPDIYVSCHYNPYDDGLGIYYQNDFPRIYINLGNGQFSDSIYVIDPTESGDLHGALIFDFDNDGDNDLLITSGGNTGNLFYINNGNTDFTLDNQSQEYGIDEYLGRGRMASVLDLDHNGIPDVVLSNQQNPDGSQPTSVFTRQGGNPFVLANAAADFSVPLASHGTLMDMNNDGVAEFVMLEGNQFRIYDIQSEAFVDTSDMFVSGLTTDYLLADFNGDLKTDVFLTRAKKSTDVLQVDSNTIHADLRIGSPVDGVTGFSFASTDSIEISVRSRSASDYDYTFHFGNDSVQHVLGFPHFMADPNDTVYQGIQNIEAGQSNTHIFIGRVDGKWKVQSSNLTTNGEIAIYVRSQSTITDLVANYSTVGGSTLDNLNINNGNFEFTQVPVAGLSASDNSRMGVAGDFDNDMDMDIYVVCSTSAGNKPNYLLENIDNQSWVRHDDGAGATGDGPGVGEAVSVGDYNNDGFLDLFVSNGMSVFFLDSAKYDLYRNQGNGNHWLGLNLIGATDTRGGYGAVVYAVAGGVKQVRTQNGGEHHRSQNDQRIHFGMGGNIMVDSLIVKWPCGVEQILLNVPVDQYMDVHEPSCTVEVPEVSRATGFLSITPNPAGSAFWVVSNYQGDATVMIHDMTGKKVDEFTAHLSGPGTRMMHSISLVPGIYSVEFLPHDRSNAFHETMKLVVR